MKRKPKGYWTKEKCHQESLKYKTRTDFNKNKQHVYCISLNNNWLNDICSHMIQKQKPKNYWTKEMCNKESLKYKSREEFKKNNIYVYNLSYHKGWMFDICSHMELLHKPKNYWTKERCKEESLKYESKSEYKKKSSGSYSSSLKNKWLDEICSHMKPLRNSNKDRCIYAYIFSDNSVYIGLTNDIKTRNYRHLSKGTIHNKIKNNISYELLQLTEYIKVNDAVIKEEEFVEKYRMVGFTILNKIKTGSIGGYHTKHITYWTKEKCLEESLKYKSRYSFQKNSGSAYISSIRNKWLDDVCSHMVSKRYSTSF